MGNNVKFKQFFNSHFSPYKEYSWPTFDNSQKWLLNISIDQLWAMFNTDDSASSCQIQKQR